MNSVCMYVKDAVGDKYLFTCANNTPEHVASFRKHATWWKKTGYKSAPVNRQPCFPVEIVIEEYQDKTSP